MATESTAHEFPTGLVEALTVLYLKATRNLSYIPTIAPALWCPLFFLSDMLQESLGYKPGRPADSSHRRGFLSCVRGFICKHFDIIIPAKVRENISFSISHWQHGTVPGPVSIHAQHTPSLWSCSNTQDNPDNPHWCNRQICNSTHSVRK